MAQPERAAMLLVPEPLTRAAFEPFGDLIEVSEERRNFSINGGSTQRYHDLADVVPGPQGRVLVSIFRAQPSSLPRTLEVMERHPLASQAFVPLSGRRWLLVVAAAGPAPETVDLRAFVARGDQGVNYAPGVWHHPLLALDAVSDFLVLDRGGPGDNCDEIQLQRPARIDLFDVPA